MIRNILVFCLVFRLVKAYDDRRAGGDGGAGNEPAGGGGGRGSSQLDYAKVTEVESIHGREAILQCPFDKTKNFATAWMRRLDRRKSPILIGRKSEKFIQSDRYSILHKEGVNDLTIQNVTQEDAGEYICQINTEPMKNYLFVLNVMRPPEIVKTLPYSARATVKEGRSVQLSCDAIGNPKPTIKWRRSDGKRMKFRGRNGGVHQRKEFTGHNLTLVNVRKNDTGDVLCIADNKIPSAVSHKFELTIHYKPRISIDISEFKHSYGGFMKIMCRIDAVPHPTQLEMRVGDRLMNPREEVISDRVVELHFERSKDFGQDVQCFAANSAGRDSKRETIPVIDFGTTSHSKSDSTNGKPSPTTQKPISSSKNQIHIYDENVDGSKNENSKNFYHQMTDKKANFSWSASATIITCHATVLLPMLIIISQFIA